MEDKWRKIIPKMHKTSAKGLNNPFPVPAKNAATAKIGNNEALVNPPLVIAKAHFINFVVSFF